MSEYEEACQLASKMLDEPYRDPDDDLSLLSRQFQRLQEVIGSKHKCNDDMEKALLAAVNRVQQLEAALRQILAGIEEQQVLGHRGSSGRELKPPAPL